MNISTLNPHGCVTRQHRTAFMLLLDMSSSMMDMVEYGSSFEIKSVAMVDICNKILQEFYMRSFRDGEVCDYFDIAIITYSGDKIVSQLSNDVNNPFVSIKRLSEMCKEGEFIKLHCKTPFDAGKSADSFDKSTIVVNAGGSSPMYEGLSLAFHAIYKECSRRENYDSKAPFLVQISDGHPTDCNLSAIVDISNKIKELHTNCGNVTMVNITFNSNKDLEPLLFPTDSEIEDHPCYFSRALARSSSIMDESYTPLINEIRKDHKAEGYRGFGCNISVAEIISMINIGTLSAVIK